MATLKPYLRLKNEYSEKPSQHKSCDTPKMTFDEDESQGSNRREKTSHLMAISKRGRRLVATGRAHTVSGSVGHLAAVKSRKSCQEDATALTIFSCND